MGTGRRLICPQCKNESMIPANSPIGQNLVEKLHKHKPTSTKTEQ